MEKRTSSGVEAESLGGKGNGGKGLVKGKAKWKITEEKSVFSCKRHDVGIRSCRTNESKVEKR